MADHAFYEAGAPPEVMRQPPPTVADVDAHPDRLFIWAVILATRKACTDATRGRVPLTHPYI
jgi:hypothetical protein